MKIEAVTVCVGYADFLDQTARYNAGQFTRWLIVTDPRDEETREVCRRHNLECLQSADGRTEDEFRKGRLIERGLQHLSKDGWRLHLDADIVLPLRSSHLFRAAELQVDTIYGCDRVMLRSWGEWQRLKESGWLNGGANDFHNRINWPHGFPVGTRWGNPVVGYVPIGFFQLWHSSTDQWRGVRSRPYPSMHNDACRTDVQHGLQWDRPKRSLLPEVIVAHLESEPSKLGANWCGRTSKPFGPLGSRGLERNVS